MPRKSALMFVLLTTTFTPFAAALGESILQLHTRSREPSPDSPGEFHLVEKTVNWDPRKTALIVVDMWDDHRCKGASQRVTELAAPMNKFISSARQRGLLIVHCPSTCVDFYKSTEARQRAIDAQFAKAPIELATTQRWGTAWCRPDKSREADLPIDDSDMGCDCETKCEIVPPWTRQIAAIEIDDTRDVISDNGQELCNLFAEHEIENVIICGVHLNMCVLGRPCGIRQLVRLGKNVVLVRDMTDTMYNHRMRPNVSHFAGTELVVEHVEKYWCPSIESTDLIGGTSFRFAEASKPTPRASNE